MKLCQSPHAGLWPSIVRRVQQLIAGSRGEAGVDALKRKNKLLTQRIKELEAQLAAINKDTPKGSSPAATSEGTAVELEVEDLTKDFGILKIEPDGRTTWHGSSRFSPPEVPLIHTYYSLSRPE